MGVASQYNITIVVSSVSNGSGIPGCGQGLEPDYMVKSGFLPRKPGGPPSWGTGWNQTMVPFHGSYHFGCNLVFEV